jgi:hypothetical protein
MPEPEEQLLDALARLHVAGKDDLVDGSRFVGMFRALRPRDPAGHAALRPVGGGVVPDHTGNLGTSVVPAPAFA